MFDCVFTVVSVTWVEALDAPGLVTTPKLVFNPDLPDPLDCTAKLVAAAARSPPVLPAVCDVVVVVLVVDELVPDDPPRDVLTPTLVLPPLAIDDNDDDVSDETMAVVTPGRSPAFA